MPAWNAYALPRCCSRRLYPVPIQVPAASPAGKPGVKLVQAAHRLQKTAYGIEFFVADIRYEVALEKFVTREIEPLVRA